MVARLHSRRARRALPLAVGVTAALALVVAHLLSQSSAAYDERPPSEPTSSPAAHERSDAEWDAPPDAGRALVANARFPQWQTRYGTLLGAELLPAREPDIPLATEAYEPPLTGTWLTRTVQAGTDYVRAMVGAPDGRVFVAINGDGLRVYTPSVATSQYAWTPIHAAPGGLLSDNINALEIVAGDLWIGTSGAGISILDLQTGAWYSRTVANSPLPNDNVNRFTYVADPPVGTHYVWVATSGGAAKIKFGRPDTWTIINTVDGLPSNGVFDVAVRYTGPTTYTYFATDNGLSRWNGAATYTPINGGGSCLFGRARRVHTDRFDDLWVIAQDDVPAIAAGDAELPAVPAPAGPANPAVWVTGGVCRFDSSSATWHLYNSTSPGLPTSNVTDFAEDEAGRMWFAALGTNLSQSGGGAVYDKDTWKMFTKANSPIYTYTVYTVQAIGEAVWWGFTANAVTSIYSPNWLRYSVANLNGIGSPSAVFLDTARVFIGTGTRFSWRTSSQWYTETLAGNVSNVSAFAPAGIEQWWVGTGGSGLYLYNYLFPAGNQHYTAADGLPSNTINALLRDSQERLWIGTPSGLALRADGGYFLTFTVGSSLMLSHTVNALAQDSLGRIWLGTGAGIAIYDLNANGGNPWLSYTVASGLPNNSVRGLARDPQGNMWAATAGGIGKWNPQGGAWTSYTQANGALRSDDVLSIASDPLGRIWAGTRFGVSHYSSDEWSQFHVPGSTLFSDDAADLASDGKRAWFVADSEVAVRGVLTAPIGNFVPTISSFTPVAAAAYEVVTITGNYYDTSGPNYNVARFCGDTGCASSDPSAEVLTVTPTQLRVRVPALAGSGPLQVRARELQSIPTVTQFQLKPKITGLNDTCLNVGDELEISGLGFLDGSAAAYVKIGTGPERVADATDPTMIRTFIRAGDTSGQVRVRLLNNQQSLSADNVTIGSVVFNGSNIQQGIGGARMIWGKRTLVQIGLVSSGGCGGQVDEARLHWKKTGGSSVPGGFWKSDDGLAVPAAGATPVPINLNNSVNLVAEFDSAASLFSQFFGLSAFDGVSITIKNNHVTVLGNIQIGKDAFNYLDTTGVQRHIRYMRVDSPNAGDIAASFWTTAVVNMGHVARGYPQQDVRLLSDYPFSWQSWTPIWLSFNSVDIGNGGNYGDVRGAVEDYLDPNGNTWGVAYVNPSIVTSSNTGRGGCGWKTVIAANGAGGGGSTVLHELLHSFCFVDSDAPNYFPNQPQGEDNHSKYNEGKWDDLANCMNSQTYRQALIDEVGGQRQMFRISANVLRQLKLAPCGGFINDEGDLVTGANAKSIMSYAPGRGNGNTFMEPVDWDAAIAQLCIGFSGIQLVSNCPGYTVSWPLQQAWAQARAGGPAAMQQAFGSTGALRGVQPILPNSAAVVTRTLRLSGRINVNDVLTTSVFYVAENDGEVTPQSLIGDYHLIVRAGDSSVLHDQRFDVPMEEIAPHDVQSGSAVRAAAALTATYGTFHLRVPFPLNAQSAEIRHNNVVIWQRSVSANAPTVNFVAPNGGAFSAAQPLTVSWTFGDLDGDPVQFGLDYSADNGATWINLSPKLLGTQFVWLPGNVPASASARLRLRASDGFNSTFATSNLFALNPAPPQALILAPSAGAVIPEGTEFTLEGSSYSGDGIGFGAFSWKQDGVVVGLTRTLTSTIGTIGVHTITLQVVHKGLTGTQGITVVVVADYDKDGMPNFWEQQYQFNPLDLTDAQEDTDGDGLSNLTEYEYGTNPRDADSDNDGVNDGAEIAKGYDPNDGTKVPPATPVLNVGALSLGFSAFEGFVPPGSKTTWVSNGGGGVLSWTASDDAPWLSVAPGSGGNGPTQLTISVNQAGLAPGNYTGHVTVTAAGAAGSPHVIEVHLAVLDFPGNTLYLPLIAR